MASPKKQYLLAAPELRNRIYYEVLKSAVPIKLSTEKRPLQPSFLRTCRQIRKEAIGVYYNNNRFEIWVYDYRGAITQSFLDVFSSQYNGKDRMGSWPLTVKCADELDETMLDDYWAWLNVCHQHTCLAPEGDGYDFHSSFRVAFAIKRAFHFVTALHSREWQQLEGVLREYLEVALHGGCASESLTLAELRDEFPELEEDLD
ncbi:hypothetical protein LTR36_001837 [Oleoguttula mirabilis]|uniref:Uncharacterized protein n=1 Tax=Oleoguttula mirabilis TaxID=1507867 RepID=A0AAV9JM63_9PEZI|nr:hypothetical protein LTR36_001837 [Oleoguttula mirabilis]